MQNPFITDKNLSSVSKIARIAGLLFSWLAVYYLCSIVFTHLTIKSSFSIFLSGMICALTTFAILSFLVKSYFSQKVIGSILIVCILAIVGMNQLIRVTEAEHSGRLLHYFAAINIFLIGMALCCGMFIARFIKKSTYIIPIAAAAGVADLWSVFLGVTSEIVQSRTAMNYLLITFPVAGKGILPLIGVTDFIFATLFLSLSFRLNLDFKKTQVIVAASFALSIFMAVASGIGIPVLPIMGSGFVLAHYNKIKITDPEEKRDAIRGLIIILLLLIVATFVKKVA